MKFVLGTHDDYGSQISRKLEFGGKPPHFSSFKRFTGSLLLDHLVVAIGCEEKIVLGSRARTQPGLHSEYATQDSIRRPKLQYHLITISPTKRSVCLCHGQGHHLDRKSFHRFCFRPFQRSYNYLFSKLIGAGCNRHCPVCGPQQRIIPRLKHDSSTYKILGEPSRVVVLPILSAAAVLCEYHPCLVLVCGIEPPSEIKQNGP